MGLGGDAEVILLRTHQNLLASVGLSGSIIHAQQLSNQGVGTSSLLPPADEDQSFSRTGGPFDFVGGSRATVLQNEGFGGRNTASPSFFGSPATHTPIISRGQGYGFGSRTGTTPAGAHAAYTGGRPSGAGFQNTPNRTRVVASSRMFTPGATATTTPGPSNKSYQMPESQEPVESLFSMYTNSNSDAINPWDGTRPRDAFGSSFMNTTTMQSVTDTQQQQTLRPHEKQFQDDARKEGLQVLSTGIKIAVCELLKFIPSEFEARGLSFADMFFAEVG